MELDGHESETQDEDLESEEQGSDELPDLQFQDVRATRTVFDRDGIRALFDEVDEVRTRALAEQLQKYIGIYLPRSINKRKNLLDYRSNPYVMMTCETLMRMEDPRETGQFLVNNKLYMGLETSFGKQVERIVMGMYPISAADGQRWADPAEKIAEFAGYKGKSREEKNKLRKASVWREIDRSSVVGDVRYLTSIKSGPRTINDSQVQAMGDAIQNHYRRWLKDSIDNGEVKRLDIVLGLTYGTPRSTNNKDNKLIFGLHGHDFEWEDRTNGVLIDTETRSVRVYRRVGQDFWAWAANPANPSSAQYAFLEVLLALSLALRGVAEQKSVEDGLNSRLDMLASAIRTLRFPRASLPEWMREDLSQQELVRLAAAMTTFYDEGL